MITNMLSIAIGKNLAFVKHNDTVRYLISAFHIVSDDNACYSKASLELQDKLIYSVGADRVQAGRWLIV